MRIPNKNKEINANAELTIVGIDPGRTGALVCLRPDGTMECWKLPMDKETGTDFFEFRKIVSTLVGSDVRFFLERALPLAMGSASAFSYGKEFSRLEIALQLEKCDVIQIEPSKWCRILHEGLNTDLKAKAKSLMAVERLFPQYLHQIPKSKSGKYHDGIIDALLIAEYGRRFPNPTVEEPKPTKTKKPKVKKN